MLPLADSVEGDQVNRMAEAVLDGTQLAASTTAEIRINTAIEANTAQGGTRNGALEIVDTKSWNHEYSGPGLHRKSEHEGSEQASRKPCSLFSRCLKLLKQQDKVILREHHRFS